VAGDCVGAQSSGRGPCVCSISNAECWTRAGPRDVCEPWVRCGCPRLHGVGNQVPQCVFGRSVQRDRCHPFRHGGPRPSPTTGGEGGGYGRGGGGLNGGGGGG